MSAVSAPGGTEFRDPNGGGAVSSTYQDENRLEVIADRLRFFQQPSNVNVGAVMQPDVIVEAVDVNNIRDFDMENMEISLSNGFLVGSPEMALLSADGAAVFGTLTFNTAANNQTLLAQSYELNSATSSLFNIIGEAQEFAPIVHLIASDIGQADNSLVQLWPDAADAGADDHATQNTVAMRPSYRDNASVNINGLPIVQFAAGKGMGIGARDLLTGGNEKTIFVVFRSGSDATTRQMLIELGGLNSGFNLYIDNLRLYAGVWETQRWWINRIIGTNRVYLAQMVYDGTRLRLSLSNEGVTSVTSTNSNNYIDPFITPSNRNGGVGATQDQTRYHNNLYTGSGFTDFFKGRMAELYVLNTSNVATRTQVFDYLNQKYGIQAGSQPLSKEGDLPETGDNETPAAIMFAPNPANGQTGAFYTLSAEGGYRLVLQNMLGMTVAVLDEGVRAAGNYGVEFSASGLPAGMYRAVLHSATGVVSVPVVIEK